jgi:hypothetical protein
MNNVVEETYDWERLEKVIKETLNALENLRKHNGKWKDSTTQNWNEEDWGKGSVIIAEALFSFLYPNVKLGLKDISLDEKILEEDIPKLIKLVESGIFHLAPYEEEEISFTESAALLLRTFSYILSESATIIPQEIKEKHLNEIGSSIRKLLKFLEESISDDKLWAPTKIYVHSGKKAKKELRLENTYHTSGVLKALYDVLQYAGILYPAETVKIQQLINSGIDGLMEIYDKDLGFFSKNRAVVEKNIVHTVFACDGILYCEEFIADKEKIISDIIKAVINIQNEISPDLRHLAKFDEVMSPWQFAFEEKGATKLDNMEDRTTIGSIANVICRALKYLPPGDELDKAFQTVNNLINKFLERRNPTELLWKVDEIRIDYTCRMIEGLTDYLLYAKEEKFAFTKRELARLLSKVLSSDEIIRVVIEKIVKISKFAI